MNKTIYIPFALDKETKEKIEEIQAYFGNELQNAYSNCLKIGIEIEYKRIKELEMNQKQ